MSSTPLTHHEIISYSAPLSRLGLQINMPQCSRADRYIEFKPLPCEDSSLSIIITIQIGLNSKTRLCRLVMHQDGLVSTLDTLCTDLTKGMSSIESFPITRQIQNVNNAIISRSYSLQANRQNDTRKARLDLRYVVARVGGLELRVDVSTGGSMPADVRLFDSAKPGMYFRDTLADGGDIPLQHRAAARSSSKRHTTVSTVAIKHIPEDLLAVLGPQWRPLTNQGDHWKGLMRLLGKGEKRVVTCERYTSQAVEHLASTLTTPPSSYHSIHRKARRHVYIRRLQPVMVFVGILALIPISWFLVRDGGVSLHPLALGLTPLLMVGVVALTTREIPIMEIPRLPVPLNDSAWQALETKAATKHPEPDKA